MRAVGFSKPLPISDSQALLDLELPDPVAEGHDILVEVKAVSVNPADTQLRSSGGPLPGETYRILGYDAAGVVKAIGSDVTLFAVGDEVWYAGSMDRQGTNAELHLVDERIVGPKPTSLSFTDAAAMPLTALTAWELLFDRFGLKRDESTEGKSLLIIGAAGGVGTMLTQIARKLTRLCVIATASTSETTKRCLDFGAHHVIDHRKPLAPQLETLGKSEVDLIACLTATSKHYPAIIDVLKPQGKIGVIDDPATLDAKPLKLKAASLHWELMFTRPMFRTPDMVVQHEILSEMSSLVDNNVLRTTFGVEFGAICEANLRAAHSTVQSGHPSGKIVLTGWPVPTQN